MGEKLFYIFCEHYDKYLVRKVKRKWFNCAHQLRLPPVMQKTWQQGFGVVSYIVSVMQQRRSVLGLSSFSRLHIEADSIGVTHI